MSKSGLQARPVYHRKRDFIEAHLTIMLVPRGQHVDRDTGRLVNREIRKDSRRYRTIEIQAGRQVITAADPFPADLRRTLDACRSPA